MIYQYIVTLKRSSEKRVDGISLVLCLISLCAFIYAQCKTGRLDIVLSAGSLLILGGCIANLLLLKKAGQRVRFRIWLLIAGICWLLMPFFQWLSLGFFILALMESQAKHPLELGFSNEGVVMNRILKKRYLWSQFSNIVLKDGMLTLDFKNNRIFQREVLDEDDADADEDEFNRYCTQNLNK